MITRIFAHCCDTCRPLGDGHNYKAAFVRGLSISELGFGMLLLYRHLMKKGRYAVTAAIDSSATVSMESVGSQSSTDSMSGS